MLLKFWGCLSIETGRITPLLYIRKLNYIRFKIVEIVEEYKEKRSLSLIYAHNLDNRVENNGEKLTNIPYVEVIGSIMYLMVCTRYDLAYSISILSRYMTEP